MIKAIGMLLLFDIPFLLIGAGLIYYGYITDDKILTDDGMMSRKLFLYLMGAFFLGLTFIFNAFTLRWMLKKRRQAKELISCGKQGTAKILKISDTGVTVNDNPRVKLQMEIFIPDYPTYQAQKTLVIPIIHIPQVQSGLTVKVLADPQDPYNEDRIGLILE